MWDQLWRHLGNHKWFTILPSRFYLRLVTQNILLSIIHLVSWFVSEPSFLPFRTLNSLYFGFLRETYCSLFYWDEGVFFVSLLSLWFSGTGWGLFWWWYLGCGRCIWLLWFFHFLMNTVFSNGGVWLIPHTTFSKASFCVVLPCII